MKVFPKADEEEEDILPTNNFVLVKANVSNRLHSREEFAHYFLTGITPHNRRHFASCEKKISWKMKSCGASQLMMGC